MKFIWSEEAKFIAGAGGTENHTIERARELKKRGTSVEIIIISKDSYDTGVEGIPVNFISSASELSTIDDTIVYIARGQDVQTIHPSYIFLHFPISHSSEEAEQEFRKGVSRSTLMTNSSFSRSQWARTLNISESSIKVVYPFAHPAFNEVKRLSGRRAVSVLYPNRITSEKGLYVFLEAADILASEEYEFVITGSGNTTDKGTKTEKWLSQVPSVHYMQPKISREDMATLYSQTDIVVIPSRNDNWEEPFGMVSVEAQHCGCRVIASQSGGLAETNCGLLTLVPAGNAFLLAEAIKNIGSLDKVTDTQRLLAIKSFTLKQSVDSFLEIVGVN